MAAMPAITLACYSLRFRTKHARNYTQLDDVSLANLPTFLANYFANLTAAPVTNQHTKKVLSASRQAAALPKLQGILSNGEYGYETDLVDVARVKPRYKRSTTEAEMVPFYYQIYLPRTGNTGILLLQRFGVLGVRSVLAADLLSKFEAAFPDMSMHILPQVPDGVLQRLLGGQLVTIVLRKDVLPDDVTDSLDEQDPEAGKMDIVITGKHGNRFQAALTKIRREVNRNGVGAINHIIEVPGFEYDRLLVDIEIGGKTQRVDLSNLAKLRARVDVTNTVQYGPDGHPTFASISSAANRIITDLRAALGI